MQSTAHSKKVLILDGYNVIHQVPALRALLELSLERARAALLVQCRAWRSRHRDIEELILVFDGDPSIRAPASTQPGVRVLFSPDRHDADRLIRDLVLKAARPSGCMVVTDDRELGAAVRRQGADVVSPAVFFAMPQRRAIGTASAAGEGSRKTGLSSSETTRITRDLSHAWGIDT